MGSKQRVALCGLVLATSAIIAGDCYGRTAGTYQTREMVVPAELIVETAEPERLIASVLAIGLGTFGAHRLYLGTSTVVPVAYALTFGGFGVLVVIDLAHLLFTRDLAPYRNNRRILMWAKPPTEPLTPP